MPTTPNMGLTLPTEDGSAGTWDTILNAALGATGGGIDGHDHTTGKGVRIPSAALNINADVAWGGYSITGIQAVDFAEVAASSVALLSSALFVSSTDHNLYFRNSLGVNVKIIDGSTLNVSIVGGIGGDYSSVGALLDYDDATDTYRFRQEAVTGVRQYAKLASGDLALYQYAAASAAAVPVNGVTLKSPNALAAPYSVTFPAAVPAAATVLMMSAAGVLTAPQTDVSLPAGCNVVLSGAGAYKHGDVSFPQSIHVAFSTGSITYSTSLTGAGDIGVGLGTGTAYLSIQGLQAGQKIKTVRVTGVGATSGVGNATYDVKRQGTISGGAATSLLAAPVVSNAAALDLTLSGGGYTVQNNEAIYLEITIPGATAYGYYCINSTRDRP